MVELTYWNEDGNEIGVGLMPEEHLFASVEDAAEFAENYTSACLYGAISWSVFAEDCWDAVLDGDL